LGRKPAKERKGGADLSNDAWWGDGRKLGKRTGMEGYWGKGGKNKGLTDGLGVDYGKHKKG